jgi:protein-disulfide isomerase
MFCLFALVIFGITGIFSASHRQLAKEALDCMLRRVTFRPCNTTFQDKAKGKMLGWLLDKSPRLAKIFNKHSEMLAWVFFVLMIGSFGYSAYGAYNFYMYGSCQGLNQSGFCVFDPTGSNNKISGLNSQCLLTPPKETDLNLKKFNAADFPQKIYGDASKANEMIFIGCFACDYTRATYPIIKDLLSKKNIAFTFAHLPVKEETGYLENYGYCVYKTNPDRYWAWVDALFANKKEDIIRREFVDGLTSSLGIDVKKIAECEAKDETRTNTEKLLEEIKSTGIYGTPTIFINGKPFVGPKPERVYSRALK